MPSPEEGKTLEDMGNQDMLRNEREAMNFEPPPSPLSTQKIKLESHKDEEFFLDFEHPRKPVSSFILFSTEYHTKIHNWYPGLSFGNRSKKVAEMWRNASAEDRRPYEEAAEKLKERYEKSSSPVLKSLLISNVVSLVQSTQTQSTQTQSTQTQSPEERKTFEDTGNQDMLRYEREMMNCQPPSLLKRKMKLRSHKKEELFLDLKRPKKPASSFRLFTAEFYTKIKNQYPELSFGSRAKIVAEMWRNTSAEDRQPYEEAAEKLKERYEKEMIDFLKKRNDYKGSAAAGSTAVVHNIKNEVNEEKIDNVCTA